MNVLNRRNYYILSILLLLVPALLAAQGSISVESQVDKSTIYIGDVAEYSVIVTHDPDVNVIMPELAENLGMFELRNYEVRQPEKVDGKIVSRTDYSISTFDTGEFEIPELQIGYSTEADSVVRFLKTEPLLITVQSMDPETDSDIRDIKPPLVPDKSYRDYIIMGLIALGILAAIAVAWYFYRRYRQGKDLLPVRSKPARPAHEVALDALQALLDGSLLADGEFKAYYIELSDIIRRYIMGRFYIDAPEMTTGQLLDEMGKQDLDTQEIDLLRKFLNGCDLVKFAKYEPSDQENESYTQMAFDYVEKTKMIIEQPETIEPVEPIEPDATVPEPTSQDAEITALPAAEETDGPDKRQEGSDV